MSSSFPRRALVHGARTAFLCAALLSTTACVDDETTPRPLPTFTRMVLRLAPTGGGIPQQVEITRATGAVSGPLSIPQQGGLLTATFFNVDGSEDEVLKQFQQEYQTRITITGGPASANFERASPNTFQVTRSGTTSGAATARVQLWDLAFKREVLGTTVTLNIQ